MRRSGTSLVAAAGLTAAAMGLLAAVTFVPSSRPRVLAQLPPAHLQLLCEGHFLDTATGIPEEPFSSHSHPEQMPGYEEPLPRSLREEIDEKYQLDPEQYQYTGCLDEGVLQEVQMGIVQARNAAALNRNLFEGRAPNLDTDAVTDAASESE